MIFSLAVVFAADLDESVSESASAESPSPAFPLLLNGIWQGSDRLIMFSSKDNEFALVLRVFYQWYNDRACESDEYKEILLRDRNNTTSSELEGLSIVCHKIFENNSNSTGVYELEVNYPYEKEKVFIPICVINDKIYLDFLIRTGEAAPAENQNAAFVNQGQGEDEKPDEKIPDGFFRAASSASGIMISSPVFKKEVISYYIHGSDIYKIRYWLSQMDYTDDKASFSDGNQVFSVNKFLKIGSQLFQCTTGRSSKIRNIEKRSSFEEKIILDDDKSIIAFGKAYLVKVPDIDGKESFIANIAERNSRKKSAPPPLFPPSEVDFHWKDISELEKYNPYTWNRRNLDIHK